VPQPARATKGTTCAPQFAPLVPAEKPQETIKLRHAPAFQAFKEKKKKKRLLSGSLHSQTTAVCPYRIRNEAFKVTKPEGSTPPPKAPFLSPPMKPSPTTLIKKIS